MITPTCPNCKEVMTEQHYLKLREEKRDSVQKINERDRVIGISRSMDYSIDLYCIKCRHVWYDNRFSVG